MHSPASIPNLPENVEFFKGPGDLPFYRLTFGKSTAEVSAHGAHVTHFQAEDGQPVLYMSPKSLFESTKAIRGGVPLCAPWFGDHPTDKNAPAHGLIRTTLWTLADAGSDEHGTFIVFETISNQETPAWPSPYQARLELRINSSTLHLGLTFHHNGKTPAFLSNALHAYFVVSDAEKVRVRGLQGVDYLDKVEGFSRKTELGESIHFHGQTDRIYLNTSAVCEIEDPGMNRKIQIKKTGSQSTVVWNPAEQKAAQMSDLGADNWRGFVCVETANAADDTVVLAPGESQHIAMQVEALPFRH